MAKRLLKVRELAAALEKVAPATLAAEWDNVGLLAGDAGAPCHRVLLTIDLTAAVLDEARELGVQAIVAYHPPIFAPIKRVVKGDRASGTSGWVTGPHLHFEVRLGGTAYDPMGWFGGSKSLVSCQ